MCDTQRAWWRNCVDPPSQAMLDIDALIDGAALSQGVLRVRRLIGSLEMCHHKAERWVELILEGIAAGDTGKGMGTRPPGSRHPAEDSWQSACDALSAWCADLPQGQAPCDVGGIVAEDLYCLLGTRTWLKVWQVEQVAAKIQSVLDPTESYHETVEGDALEGQAEEYRQATLASTIHDTVDGAPAQISLAAAIDHLEPCHWGFVQNLQTVLAAIGGGLHPERPYASCGRNIALAPIRGRMADICKALDAYVSTREGGTDPECVMVDRLADATPVKRWLAASLAATIRCQLRLEQGG